MMPSSIFIIWKKIIALSHVKGTGLNAVARKNPIISEMFLVLYMTSAVGVNGLLCWCSICGRRLHLHRPVMLPRHLVKIVFPSYFIYAAYFSSMTVQPASHSWDRPKILFIKPKGVAAFLAFSGSLRIIIR